MSYQYLESTVEVAFECRDCDTWFEEFVPECDCCGSSNIKSYTSSDMLDAKYERSFDE